LKSANCAQIAVRTYCQLTEKLTHANQASWKCKHRRKAEEQQLESGGIWGIRVKVGQKMRGISGLIRMVLALAFILRRPPK